MQNSIFGLNLQPESDSIELVMKKKFVPAEHEKPIYEFWERQGFFTAKVNKKKKPFSIILPPPNANADLHTGHAMYVYEDIMIRFYKLAGLEVMWLPGADHAGFETQYVFEQALAKKGKSRFDYPREKLFEMIWDFVMKNRETMEGQLRRLGFALDWEKKKFTMDEDIVKIVHETFKQLYNEGLVYRDTRLVNYCTRDGTSFSDLEIVYKDSISPLYYLKYGPFELATVRPETKFGDTAVAVHPEDKRYKKWIGKEVEVEGLLGQFKIKVVADKAVDPEFGTGVVKITPAHDFNDYEIAQRHGLSLKQVIGFDGKLNKCTGPYEGMSVMQARKRVVEDLKKKSLLAKVDEKYQNRIATCYKCGHSIEPLPREQWFVKVEPLARQALKAVEKKEVKIYPTRFRRVLLDWLDKFHDWNISRQIVWGIRIPAWKCTDCNEWIITAGTNPKKCNKCSSSKLIQDTDTFDTWFSSAQWPFATLLTQSSNDVRNAKRDTFFDYFYPTSVMETGYDILPWWVARMIMISLFATGKVPFHSIYLHGMVRDSRGQKMSKSKGNVINPISMIDQYGADALRAALIFSTKEGGDLSLSEEKIKAMRNFGNKIWNVGRFIYMNRNPKSQASNPKQVQNIKSKGKKALQALQKEFEELKKQTIKDIEGYKVSRAFDALYEFLWHKLADYYIEELKAEVTSGNIKVLGSLERVYSDTLILLHPYMPFVTEAVWKEFYGEGKSILDEKLH